MRHTVDAAKGENLTAGQLRAILADVPADAELYARNRISGKLYGVTIVTNDGLDNSTRERLPSMTDHGHGPASPAGPKYGGPGDDLLDGIGKAARQKYGGPTVGEPLPDPTDLPDGTRRRAWVVRRGRWIYEPTAYRPHPGLSCTCEFGWQPDCPAHGFSDNAEHEPGAGK